MMPKLKLFIYICALALSSIPAGAQFTQQQIGTLREIVNRGNMLLNRRQYAQAIAEYQKCFEIDPNNTVAKQNIALAHNNWGIVYFGQKKYSEAKNEWDEALKVLPGQRDARNNLIVLEKTLQRQGIDLATLDSSGGDSSAAPANGASPASKGGATGKPAKDASGSHMLKTGIGQDPSPNAPPTSVFSSLGIGNTPETSTPAPTSAAVPPVQTQPASTATAQSSSTQSGAQVMGNTSNSTGGLIKQVPQGDEFDDTPPTVKIMSGPGAGQNTGSSSINGVSTYGTGAAIVVPSVNSGGTTGGAAVIDSYDSPSSSANSNSTGAVMSYPPQDATQTYEDKTAGTSVTIMARPTPPPAPPPVAVPPPTVVVPAAQPAPVVTQTETPGATPATGTFDDQLAALELKVFGKKQKAMPILKRLEKLETNTSGSVGQGTIQERVDALRKAYGL